ncbi:hypothetical protein EK21DRAFT_79993, partial [Setomelanomma holmii]
MKWFSAQVAGLSEALSVIHNPPGTDAEYGRHGDIKPENVLWIHSQTNPRGTLLITDFGVSSFNRTRSRSNVTNRGMGFSATYRAPEFDIKEAPISRSYDIWAFGCVLLEMVTWLLGGWELVEEFSLARLSPDDTGILTDTFFAMSRTDTGTGHTIVVNKQVTSHIGKLHRHDRCTQYVHDLLDLIQNNMLLIELEKLKRSQSKELSQTFQLMNQTATKSVQYIMKPLPILVLPSERPALEVKIDEDIQKRLARYNGIRRTLRLSTMSGGFRRSVRLTERRTAGGFKPELQSVEPATSTDDLQASARSDASNADALSARLPNVHVQEHRENRNAVRVTSDGTISELIILAQLMCWMAATFRLPQTDQVSCSSVNFRHLQDDDATCATFQIVLQNLYPLQSLDPGTCWAKLFPSTVIAYGFPVPNYPGMLGLQIPFGAMLELAEIVCDVNLEDENGNDAGIYFDGVSSVLYPTAYVELEESKVIQWHLAWSSDRTLKDRDLDLAPDSEHGPKWSRIHDVETLRSATAILGYCGNVAIQLGTQARVQQYQHMRASRADIENPPLDSHPGTAQAGFSLMGATGGVQQAFKTRKAQRVAIESGKEATYRDLLRRTESEPIILFDTERNKERAWMVPQLSLILDLFNLWASQNGFDNIKYANPCSDGGVEAKRVLGDTAYAKRVAYTRILDSESDLSVGDVIKKIYGRMRQCVETSAESDEGSRGLKRMGRGGIVGWDLLELTD